MTDFTDEGLARIQTILDRAVADAQVPGVVAAVARGATVHVATAGVATMHGPPMRADTIFRIASVTKPMTAAAVLSLVEAGAFGLDESVERLLPELADRRVLREPGGPLGETDPAERAITVRDLLTFTWGFGMQGAMFMAPDPWPIAVAAEERHLHTLGEPVPSDTPDPDAWMAGLAELPLLAQPGERWLYQSGSQVLGVLAARAVGRPFDQVLAERLFDPLGMTDTGFFATDTSRLATAYQPAGDGSLAVRDRPDGEWSRPPAFPDGGAGLVSTASDVVRFGRMLLGGGGPVLSAATVAEMTRNQLTPDQRAVWPGFDMLSGRGWGYGTSVLDDGRYQWEGGLGTVWANVPAHDLAVVVLTQRAWDETGPPAVCEDVIQAGVAASG